MPARRPPAGRSHATTGGCGLEPEKRGQDVAATIRASGNTMAGPDRIPYAAWRALGDIAVDTLFQAGQAMQEPDFPQMMRQAYGLEPHEPHPFNLGTLVCLPKKAVAHHHELGEVYSAENTRPLSIGHIQPDHSQLPAPLGASVGSVDMSATARICPRSINTRQCH